MKEPVLVEQGGRGKDLLLVEKVVRCNERELLRQREVDELRHRESQDEL